MIKPSARPASPSPDQARAVRASGLLDSPQDESFDRLTRALGLLLDGARAAGSLRAQVSPEDLLRALVGFCIMNDQPDWQATALRLIDVFLDGLRKEV